MAFNEPCLVFQFGNDKLSILGDSLFYDVTKELYFDLNTDIVKKDVDALGTTGVLKNLPNLSTGSNISSTDVVLHVQYDSVTDKPEYLGVCKGADGATFDGISIPLSEQFHAFTFDSNDNNITIGAVDTDFSIPLVAL